MQRDLLLVLRPEKPLLFEFSGCVYTLFRRVGLRLIMDLWNSLPASHQKMSLPWPEIEVE